MYVNKGPEVRQNRDNEDESSTRTNTGFHSSSDVNNKSGVNKAYNCTDLVFNRF